MTKCIVLGNEKEKTGKPIEFKKWLNLYKSLLNKDCVSPSSYNYIELICLDYGDDLDLMFAYNDPKDRISGILYLGKWNDGFVK